MAVTTVGNFQSASTATTVQSEAPEDFKWRPRTGQVLVLIGRYEPGVIAVAPSGWTEATQEPRVLWKGREVAATLWWFQLQQDYDGWCRAGWSWWEIEAPQFEPGPLFEMPTVTFSRVGEVELDFWVLEGVEPTQLINSGTAIGRIG